jgi:hypothetical protein
MVATVLYAILLRRVRGTLNLHVLRDLVRVRARSADAVEGAAP